MVTVAALSTVGILALARCGNNGGGADAGLDAAGAAQDAQVAGQDGATAGLDAATAGMDAATAGLDAATAGVDVGPVLPPTPCEKITNFGCDAGVCFTTAISQMGAETTACGTPGAGGDYVPCGSPLDCQANFTCLPLPAASDAGLVCHQYCMSSMKCPGTAAAPENCTTFEATATVGYCIQVPACSLYTQNCTDPAQGCYPVSSGTGGCVGKGNKSLGAACTLHKDCDPGLVCPPSVNVCSTACDPTVANTCTGGLTCTQPNLLTWGYCK
jgi:hypothetical protein